MNLTLGVPHSIWRRSECTPNQLPVLCFLFGNLLRYVIFVSDVWNIYERMSSVEYVTCLDQ